MKQQEIKDFKDLIVLKRALERVSDNYRANPTNATNSHFRMHCFDVAHITIMEIIEKVYEENELTHLDII